MFEQVEVNSERWFDLKLLLNEEFRLIKDYENLYEVSNYGRIKSVKRGIIIKQRKDKRGYCILDLHKNNKQKTQKVHRLVAQAFIPNYNNYPCINHKDENKENNCIDNLEWCTIKYNNNYGTSRKRAAKKMGKKINQYDLQDNLIKTWCSMIEASRKLNIDRRSIFHCCKGYKHCKSAGGYKWQYFDNN